MEDKFILLGLNDGRSKQIAEVIGNPTCKKILNHLAENKEASEKDISDALGIAMNTVDYNIKKLVDSGIVETGKHWWSVKGKKIEMYKLARKHIVISAGKPSYSKLKALLPIVLIVGAFSLLIRYFLNMNSQRALYESAPAFAESLKAVDVAGASATAENLAVSPSVLATLASLPVWLWFLAGGLVTLIIFLLVNWRKM